MKIKNTLFVSCLLICFGCFGQEDEKKGTIQVKKNDTSFAALTKSEFVAQKNKQEADGNVYLLPDKMPKYYGGDGEMRNFIAKNIVMPNHSPDDGTVYISFIVNADGSTEDFRMLKGTKECPECDQEAIRVVKLLKGFNPGEINGVPVKTRYNIPIRFRMK